MDRQEQLPVLELQVGDRVDMLDAGVADQHVDAAQFGHGLGDPGLDRGLVGHVHGDRDRPVAGRLELVGGRLGALQVEVGDADLGALAGVLEGDLLADAAGRTGDDGDFVLEAHGPRLLFRQPAR